MYRIVILYVDNLHVSSKNKDSEEVKVNSLSFFLSLLIVTFKELSTEGNDYHFDITASLIYYELFKSLRIRHLLK